MRRLAILAVWAGVCALAQPAKPIRVLFIGNSYTYYNNLPEMLMGIANRDGNELIEAQMVTRGGATLADLWEMTPALNILRQARWDYVVLQEQSALGGMFLNSALTVNDPAGFFLWSRIWTSEAARVGAKPIFYLTWAYRRSPEFQPALTWAYDTASLEQNALLAPAGVAWSWTRLHHPEIELFAPDGAHPSPEGTYLNACVFLEVVAGRTCVGAPAEVRGHPTNGGGSIDIAHTEALVRMSEAHQEALAAAAMHAMESYRAGELRTTRPPYRMAVHLPKSETPISPELLRGTWHGPARIYASLAEITLTIDAAGSSCSGAWEARLITGQSLQLPLSDCRWAGTQLVFTLKNPYGLPEEHRAVLVDATLVGVGEVRYPSLYRHMLGTWELHH